MFRRINTVVRHLQPTVNSKTILCNNITNSSNIIQPHHKPTMSLTTLTTHQIDLIKSTIPVLRDHGVDITKTFYSNLLREVPELNNYFNISHQRSGSQQTALANSVFAYAANIDNLSALTSVVNRIAHKHASLGIKPDHYPIVGKYLIQAMKQVLGDKAITQELQEAWSIAYQNLANIFINAEQNMYNNAEWTGYKQFKIVNKVYESSEIISFYLEPVDGQKVPLFKPGQYISVKRFIESEGYEQPRQYSLSDVPNQQYYRISVKREVSPTGNNLPPGTFSNILHDNVKVGDIIDCSPPYGDFTLDVEAHSPVVLISGGVGSTPMLSMLGAIVQQCSHDRQVRYIHGTRNSQTHAMKQFINDIVKRNDNVKKYIYYDTVSDNDTKGIDYDYQGYIDLAALKNDIMLDDTDYYVCGPKIFMDKIIQQLKSLGITDHKIHYELFGVN